MGVCQSKKTPSAAGGDGIKMHGSALSTNSLSCIILVSDVGKGGLEPCDLMSGAHKQPEFLKKNPYGTVPTLEDAGGFCLSESNTILRYLANSYAPDLYPAADAKLQARIDWIMAAWGTNVYSKWSAVMYPLLGFAPDSGRVQAGQQFKESMDNFAKAFVTDAKFLAGDKLTIADYKVMPFLFGVMQPVVAQKRGVKLAPRLEKYVQDVMSASKSSSTLESSGGIKEFIASKTDGGDYTGPVLTCGEGVAAKVPSGAAKAGEKAAKVWGMPASANSVSCVLAAMDAGVGNMEMCNLMEGAHMAPDFVAKNAFHQIPVFEDSSGFCLGESTAILRYIATNYAPTLYPSAAKDKALVDWAMDLMGGSLYDSLGLKVFYPVLGFGAPPEDQKKANEQCLDLLDKYEKTFLSSKKFVAGDTISIAEYKAVPFLFAAMQPAIEAKAGFKMPARLVKYTEEAMAEMKSVGLLSNAGGYSIKEFAASKA